MHHNISMASFQEEISLPPVLLQASFVESHQNVKLGTLWDLCSTDGYITFAKAEELQLEGRDVNLTIGGVRGQETSIKSKLFFCWLSRQGAAATLTVRSSGRLCLIIFTIISLNYPVSAPSLVPSSTV